jgi:hypothetical protein
MATFTLSTSSLFYNLDFYYFHPSYFNGFQILLVLYHKHRGRGDVRGVLVYEYMCGRVLGNL